MAGRTGIFGGAFDPVHYGHIACVDSFLSSDRIDRLLVIPTYSPPHKPGTLCTPFRDRLEMLRIAFLNRGDRIVISDLESRLESPSYTVRTIRHLQEESPDEQFFLCIGEDSLEGFTSWYSYQEILQRVELLVAERPGFDVGSIPPNVMNRVTFVKHHPVGISSSAIRKRAIQHYDREIPEPVRDYIRLHGLYQTNEGEGWKGG